MSGAVEFVELCADAPVERQQEVAQPGHRGAIAAALLTALLVLIGAVVVGNRQQTRPAADPLPTGPTVSPMYRRPAVIEIDGGDVASVCPIGNCHLVQFPLPALRQYLAPFGWGAVTRGAATVYRADGRPVGAVAEESFGDGVVLLLTVLRASGALPPHFQQIRSPELSTVTLATRRDGWDLIASITFSAVVTVPMGNARIWLDTAPLPS